MLYPIFTLVLLTYAVLLINFFWRVRSVKRKEVSIKYFQVFEGGDAPKKIKAGTRHYANMFELPVLFYVVSVLAVFLKLDNVALQSLAWGFVFVRVVHAIIHMMHNNVLHRLLAFWAGALIVLIMWCYVVWQYHHLGKTIVF